MAEAPKHLCLLGDATSPHIQRWAGEMRARGYRVSLVTARPAPMDGVEQKVLAPVHRSTDWLFRVGQAQRHVQALAPDIVHAHYITSYGYLAARCGRQPLVMTAWGSDLLVTPKTNALVRWLTGWSLRRADLITGDSQSLIDAATAYGPACPVQEIHWGVDLARFAPAPWAGKTGLQIVSLRSWEPNYHIDTIVEAVATLVARHPDAEVRLHLLGGGSMEAALRALVAAKGLANHVVFHGRLDDAGMARVLAQCKLSLSVPTSDATSVSVLESMACGLAVVATDLDANRKWLDASLLVPPRDAGALARVLEALAVDDARTAEAGQRNAERIARDGDRAVQMDTMDRLYRQAMNTP